MRQTTSRVAKLIGLLGATAAASFALGAAGQHYILSPADVALRSQAPPRTPLIATVHLGHLTTSVTFTAKASFPALETVSIPEASGKVATSAVYTGALRPGVVVLTLNDRPVFAMDGKYPLYRDLTIGMVGRDVARLQQALRNAGHASYDTEGTFGASTAAAVKALYESHGFEPAWSEVSTTTTPDSSTGGGTGVASNAKGTAAGKKPDTTATPTRTVTVLKDEFLMLGQLPARIVGTHIRDGALVEDDTLSLTRRTPVLVADVNPVDAASLVVGRTVGFTDSASPDGQGRRAVIASVGAPHLSDSDQGMVSTVRLRPRRDLSSTEVGHTYVVSATDVARSEAALVPLSAVNSTAAGKTFVRLADGSKTVTKYVNVTGTSDGMAAVAEGQLSPGDKVLLGD